MPPDDPVAILLLTEIRDLLRNVLQPVADDRDLDGPFGDPVIHHHNTLAGQRLSDLTADEAEDYARMMFALAAQDGATGMLARNGKPRSVHRALIGMRARAWAARRRREAAEAARAARQDAIKVQSCR